MSDAVLPALLDMGIPHPLAAAAAARYSSVDAAVNWCFGDGQSWTPESSSPAWPSPVLSPSTASSSSSPAPPPPPAHPPLLAPGRGGSPDRDRKGAGLGSEGKGEDDAELRKALQLSMQDQGVVSSLEERGRQEGWGRMVGPLNKDQAPISRSYSPALPPRREITDTATSTTTTTAAAVGGDDEDAQLSRAIQDSLMTASMHSLRSMEGSRVTVGGAGEEADSRERAAGEPLAFYSASGDHAPTALLLQALLAVPQIRASILSGIGEGAEGEGIDQRARILRDQAELLRMGRAAVNVDSPRAAGRAELADEGRRRAEGEDGVAEGLMGGWKVGAWPVVGSTRTVLESLIDTIKTDMRRLASSGHSRAGIKQSNRLFGTLPTLPVKLQPPACPIPNAATSPADTFSFRPPDTAEPASPPDVSPMSDSAPTNPSPAAPTDAVPSGPSVNPPETGLSLPPNLPSGPGHTSHSTHARAPQTETERERERINYLVLSRSSALALPSRLHAYLGHTIWGDDGESAESAESGSGVGVGGSGGQEAFGAPQSLDEVGEVMCVLVGKMEGGSGSGSGSGGGGGGSGGEGGRRGWEIEEKISMDRYMSRNKEWADAVRGEQRRARETVRRERAALDEMTLHKGEDVLNSLRTLIEHYDTVAPGSGGEAKDEMRDEVRAELRAKLHKIAAAMEAKAEEKKAVIEGHARLADGGGFDDARPDMQQEQYELRAVLMHDGITLPGSHLYAYVREGEGWWRVRDGAVAEVDIEGIKKDKTGLYMDGGVYMLVYARTSGRPVSPVLDAADEVNTTGGTTLVTSKSGGTDGDLIDLDTPRDGSPRDGESLASELAGRTDLREPGAAGGDIEGEDVAEHGDTMMQ